MASISQVVFHPEFFVSKISPRSFVHIVFKAFSNLSDNRSRGVVKPKTITRYIKIFSSLQTLLVPQDCHEVINSLKFKATVNVVPTAYCVGVWLGSGGREPEAILMQTTMQSTEQEGTLKRKTQNDNAFINFLNP